MGEQKSTSDQAAHQHRTARQFRQPSPLFRWANDQGLLGRPGRALVLGAGLLAEATALRDLSWKIDALETPTSLAARSDFYAEWETKSPGCRVVASLDDVHAPFDLIVITHVLEFVPSPAERTALLSACRDRLALDHGRLLLSLRGWSDVNAARTKRPAGDGFVTGLGTWTRGFTRSEAEALIQEAGLTLSEGPQGARSKSPEQVRLVCRRVEK